jgi:adenine deaminase
LKELKEKRPVFPMDQEPDLFLQGGRVLNVYSGELYESNVAVRGDRIWYVGPKTPSVGDTTLRLDLSQKVLVPGYIEPHCHPWNIYNPRSFGEEAGRLGTTTLVCDNLIFFMLMGVDAFEAFMEAFSQMPVKLFWFIRAFPQTPMEEEEQLFSSPNIERLLRNPLVRSLGEITRWQEVIRENPKILHLIRLTEGLGKRVDGHTAGAKYENLSILSRAGVESCHESITGEEVLDRLRLGFHVMMRESSLRQDLRGLLKAVRKNPSALRRIMLTTDGSTPSFYGEVGVTDHLLRVAMEEGIDPVEAYRMVTLNPASYFGMEGSIGGIAPGRDADILVLKDLFHPTPELVLSKGKILAEKGVLRDPFPEINWRGFFADRPLLGGSRHPTEAFFQIPISDQGVSEVRFPVIKLVNPVITSIEWVDFPVRKGLIDVSARDGFCWVSTLNKEGKWVANGILKGYADRVEGIASTFNTATEILALGRNPRAMCAAVERVLEMGGGIAAVEEGRVAYEFPLPLGGMMSERPMHELAGKERELKTFLVDRGYPFHDPLYTFIFLPNDFLPEVRINRRGVLDIKKNETLWPARRLR